MNIWLLHPFAGGPGLGRHWRPFWLADAWKRMGHRVVLVSAAFHHLHREPQAVGPRRIDNVDFWFLETPHYGEGSLGRLYNNLSFGPRLRLSASKISEQFGRPDVIVASTPHLFFISSARRVAERYSARFWVEVRDIWPESIVALGMMSAWHPLVGLLGWKERAAYRVADRVVSLLLGAEAHMCARGLASGKFVWVPNGVSDDEIQRALETQNVTHPIIDRMKEMRAQGRRIVLYAGAMGPPNAIEVIIDAAAATAAIDPEIHFVLIGSGASRPSLVRRAMHLPNVEFLDEVDRTVVHSMLRMSECAVVAFHNNALYHQGISPNKLFDYCLFAPRTVIACEARSLRGLEDLVTLRCEPDDPAALASALVSALRAPPRPLERRIAVTKQFSYSELAARYLA